MLTKADTQACAFVATARPAEALAFYRDVLGLRLVEDSDFAIVFDAFGTMLRVQKTQEVKPAPYTTFGFNVTAIDVAVKALVASGVTGLRFPPMEQDALGIWASPSGARIFWFHDPDGNVLSLAQH